MATSLPSFGDHWRRHADLPPAWLEFVDETPWEAVAAIRRRLALIDDHVVWIDPTAEVHPTAVISGPTRIAAGARIGPHTVIRDGVYVGPGAVVGPSCEIKASYVADGAAVAHLAYVGDSVVGAGANLEAGVVVANHWNERSDTRITVHHGDLTFATGLDKFGAAIGIDARIGANAVVGPGVVLEAEAVIDRLGRVGD